MVLINGILRRFYSWRRYCNKHQIRLGGYAMDSSGRAASPDADLLTDAADLDEEPFGPGPPDPTHAHAHGHGTGMPMDIDADQDFGVGVSVGPSMLDTGSSARRDRSPTPPKALFRSTTGKGVAFTDEDTRFLVRFYEYRQ
jgi:hypothetical protein